MFARSYADLDVGAGPFAFTVDRNAPAQPQLHVVPDHAAHRRRAGGDTPRSRCRSRPGRPRTWSARGCASTTPPGPSCSTRPPPARSPTASVPASALAASGPYGVDVVECDAAGHCTASARADLRWDGSAPPRCRPTRTASPLGSPRRARGRAPDLAAACGRNGGQRDRRGVHRHRHDRRCRPRAGRSRRPAGRRAPRASSESGDPRRAHPRRRAGLRCDPPDLGRRARGGLPRASAAPWWTRSPPAVTMRGAPAWSGGAADRRARRERRRRRGVLAGAARRRTRPPATAASRSPARARTSCAPSRMTARATRPSRSARSASTRALRDRRLTRRLPGARGARGRRRRALGRGLVEVRLGGRGLETRLSADGRTAVARVPAGSALDGAAVDVRVLDASSPANVSERSATCRRARSPSCAG